ncbi:MAG: 50S ribosomal protein L17 [Rhabdochlamydiaceae bacterium]|nr:50S ribosomal protein L17 [Candidatus Amphrikana amoebophyrae]
MRHQKNTFKLGRDASHRRCLVANMLKSLIVKGQIETTITKAKVIKRHADQMVTLAKKNTLATRRKAIGELMIRHNTLTTKETRAAKKDGDTSAYNDDRKVINILFDDLGKRFEKRQGGYTRIIRLGNRVGDGAEKCLIQYLEA